MILDCYLDIDNQFFYLKFDIGWTSIVSSLLTMMRNFSLLVASLLVIDNHNPILFTPSIIFSLLFPSFRFISCKSPPPNIHIYFLKIIDFLETMEEIEDLWVYLLV